MTATAASARSVRDSRSVGALMGVGFDHTKTDERESGAISDVMFYVVGKCNQQNGTQPCDDGSPNRKPFFELWLQRHPSAGEHKAAETRLARTVLRHD